MQIPVEIHDAGCQHRPHLWMLGPSAMLMDPGSDTNIYNSGLLGDRVVLTGEMEQIALFLLPIVICHIF